MHAHDDGVPCVRARVACEARRRVGVPVRASRNDLFKNSESGCVMPCPSHLDLMEGEKRAISRGVFRYNDPCGCQDGHCAVRKSVVYIYSIYICAQPSNRPLEHLRRSSAVVRSPYSCYRADRCLVSPTRCVQWILAQYLRHAPLLAKPGMRAKAHEAGSQVPPSRLVSRVNQSADVASQGAYGQAMM